MAYTKRELADKIAETINITGELAQKSREVAERDRECAMKDQELERVSTNLNDVDVRKRSAEEEVGVARLKVADMEGSLSSSVSELGAVKQVSIR